MKFQAQIGDIHMKLKKNIYTKTFYIRALFLVEVQKGQLRKRRL